VSAAGEGEWFREAERQFNHEVATHLPRPSASACETAFARRHRRAVERGGFIALLSVEKPEAMASAKRVAEHLSGDYACLQWGKTVHPSLHVGVAVVDNQPGDPPERTLKRIQEFLTGD